MQTRFAFLPEHSTASTISFFVHGVPVGVPRPHAQLLKRKGPDVDPEMLRRQAPDVQQALVSLAQNAGESFAHIYTPSPKGFKQWKERVHLVASSGLNKPRAPIEGPIRFIMVAVWLRPKCLSRRCDPEGILWAPSSRSDWDNLGKLEDILTKLNYWHDDKQVVDGRCLKCFAEKGAPEAASGAAFIIQPIGETDPMLHWVGSMLPGLARRS